MINDWAYRLADLVHAYDKRTVLRIERLDLPSREVIALLGPTGAGKSTLLRLLAGLEKPCSGRVIFQNAPFESGNAPIDLQRRITLVFQRPLLLSRSVTANIEYPTRLRGSRNGSAKVRQLLERFRLDALAHRSAQTLSGGETQLAALARALVIEPEVLLLDEPTNNLDPARVALVEEVVAAYQRESGATVVWATHNLFQARRTAQRVALLLDGALVEYAPVHEFFEAPRDPRTAAFVRGDMVY
jgi:tungstate transport system ATP-binding protein